MQPLRPQAIIGAKVLETLVKTDETPIEPRDETRSGVAKLVFGRWVTAGSYFNYEHWEARECFVWLEEQIPKPRAVSDIPRLCIDGLPGFSAILQRAKRVLAERA